MRHLEDFLFELKQLRIEIWAEDGRLRFKAPKGALNDALRSELTGRKEEILDFLRRKALFEQPIPCLSEDEAAPISFAQQRLLFLEQLEEQQAVYNIPAVFRCEGRLDEKLLAASLLALIERHESLRACFPSHDGETTACLREAYNPLHVSDLRALPELEQQKRVDALINEHAQLAFDLSSGPLLDLHLLHLSGERQLLLFNMHHIISDGWSVAVLIREWKEIYNALAAGRAPDLPELPIQYGDYAAWQRRWLEQGILANQLDYWRKQLAGLPELLELPTDFPRPLVMGTQGQHLHISLNHELTGKIKQISREQGATVFMTLLAVFNVLLHRWSGQDDLAVGSPIANRTHPQTEGLIGFFVNTLVFRTQIDGKQSFLEVLRQVRQTALAAYDHQDIPFDYLVEQLNPARSMSHAPLFQVMFALQNTPQEELNLGGAKLSLVKPDYKIAKSDLSLSMIEQADCLACDWEYRTDLFQPETIAQMAARFQMLLEGILAAPEQPISCLPLLTAADVQQIAEWNQTQGDFPADETVVELFEAQAAKNPDGTALVFAEKKLAYAELNRRANQLAHHLMQLGVGPETLVGLCIERSPEMIVGLLGILKAGGACVPLDPDYPQERLRFMIKDSGLKVLVTQSSLLARLPEQTAAAICCLDQKNFADSSCGNPVRQNGPDNLAYVIYTSGSTGKPKGVLIEHAALSQHISAALVHYAMRPDDRMLQFTSLNFDPSIEQIFAALCSGARLIGARSNLLQAEELQQLIAAQNVTVADLPPIYWQQFLRQAHSDQLASLRLLILGGEALSFELARQSRDFLPDQTTILNAYGPTEATVSSSLFEIVDQLQVVGKGMAVPIGRPLVGTKIYIVDAQMRLVPLGVSGELCIAGPRLARGYLHRPELTAEKFIEVELFGRRERIYRTGDLARWLPDGNIEYLGRIDQQVKLRGFRIELGEIEAALTRHEAVSEAAVVCYENKDSKSLAAYVAAADGRELDLSVLRAFLKQGLPEWMIPASFTVLDRLPLTPNGKLDRRALPAPAAPPRQTALIKPQTLLEQQIAAVWQKVLKLEQISIHDNFFDLGGHSLLLLQVQSQLQKTLQQSLSVVKLFQYPTIQSLAANLADNAAEKSGQPHVSAAETSNDDDVAIIGMAGRFPGAKNIDEFWENLRNGVESVSFFSDEELLASGVPPHLFNRPDYVRAGGVLEQAEYFDAPFFGCPPKEAELLDPQQRLFLETAWTAIEHAGYAVSRMPFPVGIFAGAGTSTYFLNNLLPNQELLAQVGRQQVLMGGDKDFIAARAAYKLDLRGPALSVHTACSTSLVAVHIARQSLLRNECRMALAGGVTVFFPQKQGYIYQEGMILSPDGHCRAFDAEAQGSVGGSGVAVVVLKRLSHALQDGDTVHAVIKGSAINNDGRGRIGFTAPSVEGQARVISEAMQGLDYESISYLEAHGTATILGDPIEISALNQAYKPHASKTGYCALGSVKTNVGHLDTSAGVTGLIKTVLALQHREIPPSLHFKTPNPQINFADSPFFVNTELRSWEAQSRRAGVSSFGMGGTNAHVVLEEAPPQKSSTSRPWQLLCLSAKTKNALRQYRIDLAAFLHNQADLELADLAFTLHAGRSAFAHRGFIVGRDRSELAEQLGQEKCKQWHRSRTAEQPAQVVFMFPGQGSQYVNMALGLYQQEAKFRAAVDQCADLLLPHLNLDIRELIYPSGPEPPDLKGSQAAQPALFVIEYALAQLCMAWGIQPVAMIGHSIGEYAAACLAGVFSLPDALRLVAVRGRLMQSVPAGEMLGILLPADEVRPLLPEAVFIAAHNAPNLTTVSGPTAAVSSFSSELTSRRIMHSRLQTLNAAHSPVMESILPQFRAELEQIVRHPPQRPYISNLTGTWITAEQACSTDYWCEHLLKPVQFSQGLQALLGQGADILLELGPEMALTSFAQQHRALHKNLTALNILRTASSTQDDIAWLLNTLGQLWLKNVPVDWAAFYADEQRLRIPAPTYPFERQRYWIEPVARQHHYESAGATEELASESAASTADARAAAICNRPDSDVDYLAPRTAAEQKIAEIWQLLLGIEPVGVFDDFFKLGGNSLLGAQVLSRLREVFAADIPLDILFQHPVLEELAQWLEGQQGKEAAAVPPILPQEADAPSVMSFGQQRLHFLAQLEGESATYNLPGVLHLAGKLHETALRQAFAALTERHESLRLCFPVSNGEAAVQRIPAYDPLEIQDISNVPPEERERFAKDWIAAHAQEPFNLSAGPLLRLHLLRLGAEEHLLLLNMHHIISDAWTIGILIRDWSELYAAFAQNRKPTLPDLPVQYTDYAAWQRTWLQGKVLEQQLAYWREKLASSPELLELPTDYPRPAVTSYQGGHLKSRLDRELTQRIKQFSQEQGATVFMTLLAAFKALLFRYSGQSDLLVGSPIANRTHHATENLLGFFVNTLVLRTVVAEQDDFLHLLQQVKQTALEAYNHQDIPFEYLVEQLNPGRSLSHAPLFQVMFVLQNAPEHKLVLDDVQATVLEMENRTSKFDLTLSIEERQGCFACDWEYSTDLFRPETIARMSGRLQMLLQGILADSQEQLTRLPLLTDEEERQLAQWNDTAAAYPKDKTLADLFEAQARANPDNLAVVFAEERLTYRQLNEKANQAARALMERGVQADTLVGICAERSPEMIIGLLGILKAGGAYVPLDPDYPEERLRFMLEDCGAQILLTQTHLHDRLPDFQGTVLDLDEPSLFAERATENPVRSNKPENLAYVIYTSGSTGTPKGVMIEQGSVTMLLHGFEQLAPTRQPLRGITVCPFSFDVSVWEIFTHLCFGGSLHLLDLQRGITPAELAGRLLKEQINSLYLPPALLEPLADELEQRTATLDWLRLLVGVEPISQGLMQRYRNLAPALHILNGYGPTEATVCATAHCFAQADEPKRKMPIGKPLPGYRIYVLDGQMQPVPLGVPGELCIAGDGLARGYLHRPELTAEKFVEVELFGRTERIYRSGDLARWLPDGNLEYLGRIDHQVKLRGFRIELGEIEAALTRHDAVAEAVVVLRENQGDKFLAAYLTAARGATIDAAALRAFLKSGLPEWMIPASFTVLDALPLTPNGKIDRKALPEPTAPQTGAESAPLRTETELLLAGLYSSLLHATVRSSTAHFFELGGHSLLAMQFVSRIRDSFGVEMPLRALFEHPVLADLAAWLEQQQRGGILPLIQPLPESALLRLSPAQERLWFLARLEGPSATYNMPAAVMLRGKLDIAALRQTFVLLTERHQSLRMRFPDIDGQAGLRLGPPYDPLTVTSLADLAPEQQEAALKERLEQHTAKPFDLEHGPLLRLELLRLGGQEHVLLFNMHHIISDGWSMSILLREAGEIYAALAQGQNPELRPLPVQYADYAAWQRELLAGELLASQLSWWEEQLAGAPPLLQLPADHPRPAVQSYRGGHLESRIAPELTQRLHELARQENCTLFMTLAAAFSTLLQRHSGQDDFVIGSPIAGRTLSQTEGLIGLFVNTLALRIRCQTGITFSGLLGQVRRTALDAYAHQDIPFEHLVERLRPERSLSHSPVFQVMFVLQNNEELGVQLPGLEVEPVTQDFPAAKFDLTLSAEERGGELVLGWEYASDLFAEATVRRMAERFAVLLEGIAAQPETDIRSLPLLTDEEERQLAQWNDTAAPLSEALLHTLFLQQAEAGPERLAVVSATRTLTYAELRQEAMLLAGQLRELGAGQNQLVAVVMEKGWEQVVAVLGILLSGAAYLPVDPELPAARQQYLLEQGDVQIALTQPDMAAQPDWPDSVQRLLVELGPCERTEALLPEITQQPTDLAYVIYTSGSTGLPKGVAIDHRGAVNTILDINRRFGISAADRALALSALHFDLSVYDIFGLLAVGGTVVMPAPEARRDPLLWAELLTRHGVTVWNSVPALMQMLVDHQHGQPLPAQLRLVMMSGDWIPLDLPERIRQLWPAAGLISLGGATEVSIWSIFYPIGAIDPAWTSIPYGRPLTNQTFHVLNDQFEPCPVRVAGQLYIGGIGLAKGYWRDQERTDASFITHPRTGERLYKTGDLGRWLPDGTIEFLGREDNQVKIRGHRIELGEIEAALVRQEAVKEAAAVVWEQESGKLLAAYLTVGDAKTELAALREALKQILPDYMIPASFTVLDKLPLTANGKIDRKALPRPDFIADGQAQAPQTAAEVLLCALWSQTLKMDIADVRSNFFEIGGHSLLATQLVSRIREGFGVEVPLRIVFELPVLAEQAAWLAQQQRGQALPTISPLAEDAPLAMSFAQQRLWFLARLEGQNAAYNMPIALRLRGPLDEGALRRASTALIARHESLRLCFPEQAGTAGVQRLDLYEPLTAADLSGLSESEQQEQVQAWIVKHGGTAFDLTTGPLFSLLMLRLGERDHVLLFNMHHIISDGWSMGILVRDWRELYCSCLENREADLPELSIQYTDFAAWQKSWLHGAALQEQLEYWRGKLAGAPELLELPADYPRPAEISYQGQHLQSALPAELAQAVRLLSRQHGATVFMTLLSAFNVLLHRCSGQTDLLVGSPIANRTQQQTEDLIGFFVNTLVLRSQLGPDQTFAELLTQIRQTALEAYSHQDIPFEYLVEQLNPARSLSYSPLFQVMFILQNAPQESLEFSGVSISFIEPELTTAKFDLTLSIAEQDDGFICDWEYSTDLFAAETISRMAGHFQTLLREIVKAPEQPYSSFSLLTPAEEQELRQWNQRDFACPQDKTLVDLFEEQAARRPGNIAVAFAQEQLCFAELNQRANQLAWHLAALGVGPDTLVGLCVERSLDMLTGLLGILKAGGAYMPLDPEYPPERLHFMLKDAAVKVLLTQQHLVERLPEHNAALVCMDSDWEKIAEQPGKNLSRQSRPEQLAYVIHTSGSTGRPKGVMIEHAALVNFLCYMQQRIGIQEHDKFLAVTTLSFDIAALELHLPLISGSQCVLLDRETAMNGDLLMQVLAEQGITIMQATPATWKLLLHSGWQQRSPLTILCGGEAMPAELGRQLLGNCQRLWNVYGPTETTIWSSMQDVASWPERPELIGQPIGNTQMYILDEHGGLVPPGLPGELCIGGHGLARGYLNRPELTAEKFVELELFGQRQRIYKTGDLARLLRNGTLECLGRIDHQVKLRGFRIELGEIEAALNKHPSVQEAAVIANQEQEQLAAYIVPRLGGQADSADQEAQTEKIKQWQQVWNDTYSQSSAVQVERQRNTTGWSSSYTMQPIPDQEMQEWLDGTVERILSLAPSRILEIGCGTGMLLFRLTPHCERYIGADISPAALSWIAGQQKDWEFSGKVTLRQMAADQLDSVPPGSVDLVILNSVIQYFPSIDYLLNVLEKAASAVAPGGSIFIGDVRNFQLFEAFHASVQLFQADDGLAVKELRQRVQASMSRERELLLDPDFFMALQERIPAVSQVLVELKQGLAQNEMTRFRYDVTLHLGAAAPALPAAQMQRLDWRKDALTMARIRHKLAEQQADIIEISRIPNARLAEEKKLLEQLAHFNGTVAELRDMARATAAEAVAPEIFHALTQSTPCTCSLHYGGKFHYTAVFQRKAPGQPLFRFVPERPALLPKPWRSYANNPSADLLDKIEFAATLRDFLQKQLPAYMLPSSFTVLEKLPLTPNGKIDRKALPEPDAQRRDKAYQTPRDTVELQLTQIWEELLQVHSVGIKDNFFELGGHSLLAVRLMAQIEQKFKQRIALTTLFHNSSIEEIARILRQQTERLPWSCLVPIQPSGKKPPLFCVHPAGGNVLCYLELARQLGPEQPFYAFQAFGLEADQEPVQHVAEMAKQYIEAMRAVQPHGPYQLMGWSFGGLVVFEMAGQLEAKGESVAFLGLLDAIAPHIIREILQEPEDDAQFFVDYFAEADAALSLEYLRRLSPDEQLAHVVEQGRKINIFPPDVDLMQTKRLIRVYKSNMSASLRFQAQTCGSRVTLFQAAERRPEDPALPPEHGWQEYAEQPVEVFKVPGKHHTMVNSPHVEALAKRMRTCLERAAEMAAILKHAA